jgi:dTDP-4-amino-4,6-dideoxygalactose transaminase
LINEPSYIERAEIIGEKGTNRNHFFRGQVDRYTWVDVGSSYLPSDILAAFLFAQFEHREQIQSRPRHIWEYYNQHLAEWARKNGVRLPFVPGYSEHRWHMFYMLMPSLETRQALITHLRVRGIHSVFHYLPLHLSEMGRRWGGKQGDCPVTEHVSDCLIRLPFYNEFNESDQQRVVSTVSEFHV